MLVDMTANASRPGTRKSGGLEATAPKKTSSTTGTTTVISRLSPRRNVRIKSKRTCASRPRITLLVVQCSRCSGPAGRMASVDLTPDSVRSILGVPLSDQEVGALIEWYEALGRGLAGFPETDL